MTAAAIADTVKSTAAEALQHVDGGGRRCTSSLASYKDEVPLRRYAKTAATETVSKEKVAQLAVEKRSEAWLGMACQPKRRTFPLFLLPMSPRGVGRRRWASRTYAT